MAINVIAADSVADFNTRFIANDGDGIYVLGGVSLFSLVTSVIEAQGVINTRVWVDGTVFSGNWGQGIYMYGLTRIEIGATGRVVLGSRTEYAGIDIGYGTGGSTLTNRGEIAVGNGTGVSFERGDNKLINFGSIDAGSNGVTLGLSGGNNDQLINHGRITSTGVDNSGFYYGNGVLIDGNRARVSNDGIIATAGLGNSGIRVGSAAGGGDLTVIDNSGTIESTRGVGILSALPEESFGITIRNFGTIRGLERAIELNAGNDLLVNRGQLVGDVLLGVGADRYDGRHGSVVGTVAGGFGDDLYILDDADTVIVEFIFGGTDTVRSSVGQQLAADVEVLVLTGNGAIDGSGNEGANSLTGNDAGNRLSGQAGDDSVLGGGGDDRLFGNSGNDEVTGDGGNDVLFGGDGDDRLTGSDGDDVIVGGLGLDILRGGLGRDRFEFRAAAETLPTFRDMLRDFAQGEDLIDLSAIDAIAGNASLDAFTFVGTGPLTGAGQLRYALTGSITRISFDIDGDGVADGQIGIDGLVTLTAADFVL